jgi:hypothetical protein
MAALATAGQFATVCQGTPWVNATICSWVAARAADKSPKRPDSELFRAYFTKEHWKKVYGHVLSDADSSGNYEVQVGGYRHHCILDTDETKFTSKGAFSMWVQEQPETREVTVNSGATQQWVVLEEATLAQTLMDLAHSGAGIEGTALAKNAMQLIAKYEPYAERKGELPTLPAPPTDAGAPAPTASEKPTTAPQPPSNQVPSPAAQVQPASAGAARPATPPTPTAAVASPGPARIKQCCNGIRTQAKNVGASPEANIMLGIAVQCDIVAVQAGGDPGPGLAQVRRMLQGHPVPPACAGSP